MDLKTQLKNLIKEKNYSISYVARAINVSTATLHLWINDNYKGKVEKVTKAVEQFIELENLRNETIDIPFVNTSIAEDIFEIAKICHVENEGLARNISDIVKKSYPDADVLYYKAGGLCSYYAERGGIILALETE